MEVMQSPSKAFSSDNMTRTPKSQLPPRKRFMINDDTYQTSMTSSSEKDNVSPPEVSKVNSVVLQESMKYLDSPSRNNSFKDDLSEEKIQKRSKNPATTITFPKVLLSSSTLASDVNDTVRTPTKKSNELAKESDSEYYDDKRDRRKPTDKPNKRKNPSAQGQTQKKTRTIKKSHGKRSEEEEEDEEEEDGKIYCLLCKPFAKTDQQLMIQCDDCDEWYHVGCVGLTQKAAKRIKKYYCPRCVPLEDSRTEEPFIKKRTVVRKDEAPVKMKRKELDKEKNSKNDFLKEEDKDGNQVQEGLNAERENLRPGSPKEKQKEKDKTRLRAEEDNNNFHTEFQKSGEVDGSLRDKDKDKEAENDKAVKRDGLSRHKYFESENEKEEKDECEREEVNQTEAGMEQRREEFGEGEENRNQEQEQEQKQEQELGLENQELVDQEEEMQAERDEESGEEQQQDEEDEENEVDLGEHAIDFEEQDEIREADTYDEENEDKEEDSDDMEDDSKTPMMKNSNHTKILHPPQLFPLQTTCLIPNRKKCLLSECNNSAKPNSKYCSDECGMNRARALVKQQEFLKSFETLKQTLLHKIKSNNVSVADAEDLRSLDELETKQRAEKRKLIEIDTRITQLEEIIRISTHFLAPDVDEDSKNNLCTLCGDKIIIGNLIMHSKVCEGKSAAQLAKNQKLCGYFHPETCPTVCDFPLEKCLKHKNWHILRRHDLIQEKAMQAKAIDDMEQEISVFKQRILKRNQNFCPDQKNRTIVENVQ